MQYFLIPGVELSVGALEVVDAQLLHQMSKVLRFKVGQECYVMDGCGRRARAQIVKLHKKGAELSLGEVEHFEDTPLDVRLYCALSKKPATFELIVQKATEMGANRIVPLVTERVQVDHVRKPERLGLIVREACEQSERLYVPELSPSISFEELLALKKDSSDKNDVWLYGDAREDLSSLSSCLSESQGKTLHLVIGPEGGLSENELNLLEEKGFCGFKMGSTVLRMETAAISALALCLYGVNS